MNNWKINDTILFNNGTSCIIKSELGRGSYGKIWLVEFNDQTTKSIKQSDQPLAREINILQLLYGNMDYLQASSLTTISETPESVLVMEILQPLPDSIFPNNPVEVTNNLNRFEKIVKDVKALHERYMICHNDLHKGNIMQRDDNTTIIIDYGLACEKSIKQEYDEYALLVALGIWFASDYWEESLKMKVKESSDLDLLFNSCIAKYENPIMITYLQRVFTAHFKPILVPIYQKMLSLRESLPKDEIKP